MGVCDWRECVAIGGVCGDWGSLWRLGEFVVIGGVCGDWESLWRLGEFVAIGGVCDDWESLAIGAVLMQFLNIQLCLLTNDY